MSSALLPAAPQRVRWKELGLLLFPAALALVGFALLRISVARAVSLESLAPGLGLISVLLAVHLILTFYHPQSDQILLPIAGTLTAIGLVMVYRLAPAVSTNQLIWIIVSAAALVAALFFQPLPDWLRRYPYTWAILGISLVGLTLLFGHGPGGSVERLWLRIGPLQFQPSEVLKVLLIVFLAGYLDRDWELLARAHYDLGRFRLPPLPYLGPLLAVWGFSMLLLVSQRDLGMALLFFGIFLVMLYIATGRGAYIIMGLVLFVAGVLLVVTLFGHVRDRFDVWLNPWASSHQEGFQIVQGLLAFAAGGIFGQGLNTGSPTYIPAVHTDYVFAAIGEEMGLMGSLAVLAMYILLVYRGYFIAIRARDTFGRLLAAGLTTGLGLQALIITAGNLKLIPLTGVTLPFVSYGGSSLVTNYFLLALLLRIPSADP